MESINLRDRMMLEMGIVPPSLRKKNKDDKGNGSLSKEKVKDVDTLRDFILSRVKKG